MTDQQLKPARDESARVERLLRQAALWEPATLAPDDLCARVSERISRRVPRWSSVGWRVRFAPYSLVAVGAAALTTVALLLPGQEPKFAASVSSSPPPVIVSEWLPPHPNRVAAGVQAGSGIHLASHLRPRSRASLLAQESTVGREANGMPRFVGLPHRKSAFPKFRRHQRRYANRQRQQAKVQRPSQPIVALDSSPAAWQSGAEEQMALIPIVLAEYEARSVDGDALDTIDEVQATFTPVIVAVSLKPDTFAPNSGMSSSELPPLHDPQ